MSEVATLFQKKEVAHPTSSDVQGNAIAATILSGFAAAADPTLLKPMAKAVQLAMMDATGSDSKCEPNFDEFCLAKIRARRLDPEEALKQFKEEANMVNTITDAVQQVYTDFERFEIQPSAGKAFFSSFRDMCGALDKYNKVVSAADQTKTPADLKRHWISLSFYYDKFIEQHRLVNLVIDERRGYELKYEEAERAKTPWGKFYASLQWLWARKKIGWIVGALLYNSYWYYLPAQTNTVMNTMIRLIGVICYTFAADSLIRDQLFNLVLKAFGLMVQAICFVIGFIPGVDRIMRVMGSLFGMTTGVFGKTLSITKSVLYHTLYYFTISYITTINKAICTAMVYFGAAANVDFQDGSNAIWTFLHETTATVGKTFAEGSAWVDDFFIKRPGKMLDAITAAVLDLLVNKIGGTAKRLISQVAGGVGVLAGKIASLFEKTSTDLVALESSTAIAAWGSTLEYSVPGFSAGTATSLIPGDTLRDLVVNGIPEVDNLRATEAAMVYGRLAKEAVLNKAAELVTVAEGGIAGAFSKMQKSLGKVYTDAWDRVGLAKLKDALEDLDEPGVTGVQDFLPTATALLGVTDKVPTGIPKRYLPHVPRDTRWDTVWLFVGIFLSFISIMAWIPAGLQDR